MFLEQIGLGLVGRVQLPLRIGLGDLRRRVGLLKPGQFALYRLLGFIQLLIFLDDFTGQIAHKHGQCKLWMAGFYQGHGHETLRLKVRLCGREIAQRGHRLMGMASWRQNHADTYDVRAGAQELRGALQHRQCGKAFDEDPVWRGRFGWKRFQQILQGGDGSLVRTGFLYVGPECAHFPRRQQPAFDS